MTLVVIIVILAIAIPAVAIGVFSRRQKRRFETLATTIGEPAAPPLPTLGERLSRSRDALGGTLSRVFQRGLGDETWTALEETLIAADVGVGASSQVVARVRASNPADASEARQRIRDELVALFEGPDRRLHADGTSPAVIVVVGVNGSGKTTFIAKLAGRYRELGAVPLLAAADTFRAGAGEQLRVWADRLSVDLITGSDGADPTSVAFDAYQAAKARSADVVIVDTAGRLHSDANLMEELGKLVRVLEREAGGVNEVLLVIDGTGGQNGLAQASAFLDAVGVTGVVITKLDGTAKGGIAVAVEKDTGVPVKLIGVGEDVSDLLPFDPAAFVDALLDVG